MYSKYKTKKLVNYYAPKIIDLLGMNTYRINIHVYKQNAKKLKDIGILKSCRCGNYGISYNAPKSSDIILCYDMFPNKKEALSTLLHELLHVRLHKLFSMITIYQDRASRLEEKLVKDLEHLFIEYLS
jgi:hypothetical protein